MMVTLIFIIVRKSDLLPNIIKFLYAEFYVEFRLTKCF